MKNEREMLEVVDENDNVIGLESREKIHREGLLHREIHISFVTPNGEIIFQHRAKDKDTYPDKLDVTVGGHVEQGTSYEETAVKECKEETGIDIDPGKLVLLETSRVRVADKDTGSVNNFIGPHYGYLYEGGIDDLIVEKGKATGFEAWEIDRLSALGESDKNKFIPFFITNEGVTLFEKAKKLLLA